MVNAKLVFYLLILRFFLQQRVLEVVQLFVTVGEYLIDLLLPSFKAEKNAILRFIPKESIW